MGMSDILLVRRWTATRDADAFTEIVSRHSAMVYATCLRILGNSAEAEDVTQDCFIELAQARTTIRSSLGGWLHRAAVHQSLDRIKMESRRKRREVGFVERVGMNNEVTWDDIQAHIDDAIAALPDKLREPVIYRFLEGQTQNAIARNLRVSSSTVQYRLSKGIEEMRKFLKKRGVVAPSVVLASLLGTQLTAEAAPATLIAALGKLTLAGATGAVGATAGTSGTSIVTLGGIAMVKKLVIGAAVLAAGSVTIWTLNPNKAIELVEPALEVTQAELPSAEGTVTALAPGEDAEQRLRDKPVDAATDAEQVAATSSTLGSIMGKVYKAETSEPLPDVEIHIEPTDGTTGAPLVAKTNGNGRYRFTGLGNGIYSVWRESRTSGLPPLDEDQKILVATREKQTVHGVDFPVVMGLRVAGNVVDTAGHPVAGATVEGRSYLPPWPRCITEQDGAFELFGFEPTRELVLEAVKGEELLSEMYGPVLLEVEGLSDVVLTMYPAASISGRLVDRDEEPIADALVWPSPKKRPRRQLAHRMGRTAQDGAFSIAGLAAGTYELGLSPKWWESAEQAAPPWDEFELAHGQNLEGITAVWDGPPAPELSITGCAIDTEGNPVEEARVAAVGGGSPVPSVRTDEDGCYEIEWVADGFYIVMVEHGSFVRATRQDVQAGSEGIDFVLEPRAMIEGCVLDDETGAPVTQFEIDYSDEYRRRTIRPHERFQHWFDEAGRFRIEKVEPGPVTIMAKAPGYGESAIEIPHLRSGQTIRNVEIRLGSGTSLSGVVVDTEGHPVENAYIIPGKIPRLDEYTDVAGLTKTDSDGAFRLTGQPLDLKLVAAHHPDYAMGSTPVTMSQYDENTVTIVLSKGGTIEGTVYYGGEPQSGRAVELMHITDRSAPIMRGTTTAEDGTYRFERMMPGHAIVSVVGRFEEGSQKGRQLSRTVAVKEGESVTVDFRFSRARATVEGLITFEGEPLSGAHLNLHIETSDDPEVLVGDVKSDGWYRFEDVPVGLAVLQVWDRSSKMRRRAEFEIGEDQIVRQDIEFAAGAAIAGRVTGLHPDEHLLVYVIPGTIEVTAGNRSQVLSEYHAQKRSPIRVDGNGPYHCGGLEPGDHTVVAVVATGTEGVSHIGHTFVVAHVDVADKSTYQLDLVID